MVMTSDVDAGIDTSRIGVAARSWSGFELHKYEF